ncbi:hypothetical protein [Lonomia obliqua multiple nucleopolyhedrovirus]|uniref:Uncharacterized protein n=1 Tax=Lonomia obliqua multiple nucleopolyhedrovirus TaxID=134394 RepID=A0A126FC67_9ABAC|nr:hypothetical protein [Lonomia obliqua multiple nucleopolyhedrovirus]AKN80997.1 hypothetical protein [Lonomia obliqua multiple nucleopolyhedrovirus]
MLTISKCCGMRITNICPLTSNTRQSINLFFTNSSNSEISFIFSCNFSYETKNTDYNASLVINESARGPDPSVSGIYVAFKHVSAFNGAVNLYIALPGNVSIKSVRYDLKLNENDYIEMFHLEPSKILLYLDGKQSLDYIFSEIIALVFRANRLEFILNKETLPPPPPPPPPPPQMWTSCGSSYIG